MNSLLPEKENKREYVQSMFARIAGRYDLMNHIMTFGQDSHWRELVIRLLDPRENKIYIDAGAGTGDLSLEIIRKSPGSQVIAVDLTFQMLTSGKIPSDESGISRVVADAQALPFQDEAFSGAVSGYLFRNVPDISNALSEQYRVMADDARIVSLDTTPPAHNFLYPFILIYLKWIIPLLGKIIVNDKQAYEYLPESTRRHISAIEMARKMTEVGFIFVNWNKLMFGTMAIHSAIKGKNKLS
jgi:demethylmenaquinone methyltransferase/2-methoxy-6-polyprenyl-1,4-benzoquinol methylase